MAGPRKKTPKKGAPACQRAVRLLNEKVLDVLERLLDSADDKLQLAAAKEIKEIARGADDAEDAADTKPSRVFVVTGIDRKPGEQ